MHCDIVPISCPTRFAPTSPIPWETGTNSDQNKLVSPFHGRPQTDKVNPSLPLAESTEITETKNCHVQTMQTWNVKLVKVVWSWTLRQVIHLLLHVCTTAQTKLKTNLSRFNESKSQNQTEKLFVSFMFVSCAKHLYSLVWCLNHFRCVFLHNTHRKWYVTVH